MKQLIMVSYFFTIAIASFAQADCSKNHPVYKFEKNGSPKEIQHYGAFPEFPFLRNLSTAQQFVTAIHKHQGKSMKELNNILMGIGFEHGAKDVKISSVAVASLSPGTIGNMGDAAHNYVYAKLEGDANGVKVWKVTSDNGCFVYFIAKCGNAFYPQSAVGPAAATNEPQPSPEEAQKVVCKDKVYIYYGGIKSKARGWDVYADEMDVSKCTAAGVNAEVVRTDEPVKEYNTTDINVERTNEYLGYRKIDNSKDDSRSQREFNKEYRHRRHCGCRSRE